jgi:hypothetical protein
MFYKINALKHDLQQIFDGIFILHLSFILGCRKEEEVEKFNG